MKNREPAPGKRPSEPPRASHLRLLELSAAKSLVVFVQFLDHLDLACHRLGLSPVGRREPLELVRDRAEILAECCDAGLERIRRCGVLGRSELIIS